MSRAKKIILKIGLTVLSLLVSLILTELVIRYYLKLSEPISDKDCRKKDELLHHVLIPLTSCRSKTKEWDIKFKVNSLGLRDYEYNAIKPDNTFRILMLGDSFTEGYGVEINETFSKILEKNLNFSFKQNIEVINAGITGYSPMIDYLYLQNKGLELEPDLVILNYSMTDFYDDWKYKDKLMVDKDKAPAWEEEKMFTEKIPQSTWLPLIPTAWKWWLHQNLASYDFIALRFKKIFSAEVYKDNLQDFKKGEILTDQLAITREKIDLNDYQILMNNTQNYLLEINQLLIINNIDFMLTIIPYGHQVNGQEWNQGRSYWKFDKDKIYSSKSIEDLKLWAENNNITVINLLNSLQRESDQLNYFSVDGHWNKNGHQTAADEIYKHVVKELTGGDLSLRS